jgi:hypothetical protein
MRYYTSMGPSWINKGQIKNDCNNGALPFNAFPISLGDGKDGK